MLAFGKLGEGDEGLKREGLVVDGAFVASHLLWESAALVELVDGLLVDADAPVEEIVVRGDDAGRDGGEAAPVVMIVGLLAGFVEVDGAVGDLVHPLDVAFDLAGSSEGSLTRTDSLMAMELRVHSTWIPGLGAFLGIVVEEGTGLCPGVDLLLGALGFVFAGGDEPLVHAGGDAMLEVVVGARGVGFGGVDGAVAPLM